MTPKTLVSNTKSCLIVLTLLGCLPIYATPECKGFYDPSGISQALKKTGLVKSIFYRLLGKSEDPIVNQLMKELNDGWRGNLSEARATIAPLFLRYRGKLTAEQFTQAAIFIAKKTASTCDFCALVGFKAIVKASEDYNMTSEQIDRFRAGLTTAISKTKWNPFMGDSAEANVLLFYSAIGKRQTEAMRGIESTYEAALKLNSNSRKELYQSLNASINGRYEGFTIKRWGQKGLKYLEAISQLQKEYAVLIDGDLRSLMVDTGFVLHISEAIVFLKKELADKISKNDRSPITPWDLRESFKQALGQRKMYRALSLTDSEYKHALSHGLESTFLRTLNNGSVQTKENKRVGGDNPFTASMPLLLETRLSGSPLDIDPIVSISNSPDVAVGATIPYYSRQRYHAEEPLKIYLFEIEVPELEIYRRSENPNDILNFEDTSGPVNLVLEDTTTNEKKTFQRNHPDFEIFMDLKIDLSEIKSSRAIDLKKFPNRAYWTRKGAIPTGRYGEPIYLYDERR